MRYVASSESAAIRAERAHVNRGHSRQSSVSILCSFLIGRCAPQSLPASPMQYKCCSPRIKICPWLIAGEA